MVREACIDLVLFENCIFIQLTYPGAIENNRMESGFVVEAPGTHSFV
jgi:hypothetical protein